METINELDDAIIQHTLYRRRPDTSHALILAESCNVGSESGYALGFFGRLVIAMNWQDHGGPLPHIPPEQLGEIEGRVRAAEDSAGQDQQDIASSRPSECSERWAMRCVYLIGLITAIGIWRGFA